MAAAFMKRCEPRSANEPVPGFGNSGRGGDSSSEPVSSNSVSEAVDCRDREALRCEVEGGGACSGVWVGALLC